MKNFIFKDIKVLLFIVIHLGSIGYGNFAYSQTGAGVNTTTPKSNFEVNGSIAKKISTVTSDVTLDETHSIIVCDNGATEMTVNLPSVSNTTGRVYTIKKGNSTSHIMIDAYGAETIDGSANIMLMDDDVAITIFNSGIEWKITTTTMPMNIYPMGEVSYFSITGNTLSIATKTADGTADMYSVSPATTFNGMGMTEFDNGGSNNGTLRYIGKTTKTFHIACTISLAPTGGGSEMYIFGIAKNATASPTTAVYSASKIINRTGSTTDIQSTSLHAMITLAPNDTLKLCVGNVQNPHDISIKTFNLFALGIGM